MEVKMKHDLFENIQFFDLSQNIALGEMLKVLLTLIPLCIPHIHGSTQKTCRNSSLFKE